MNLLPVSASVFPRKERMGRGQCTQRVVLLGGLGNRREDVEADLDLGVLVERDVALGRGNTNRLARARNLTTLAEIHLDRELRARDRHLDVFHDSVFLVVEWEVLASP